MTLSIANEKRLFRNQHIIIYLKIHVIYSKTCNSETLLLCFFLQNFSAIGGSAPSTGLYNILVQVKNVDRLQWMILLVYSIGDQPKTDPAQQDNTNREQSCAVRYDAGIPEPQPMPQSCHGTL